MTTEQENMTIGMGVTQQVGSDSYPYTIVEVVNARTLKVQQDNFKRIDKNGYGGQQEYEYTPNPKAGIITITLRKNGHWYKSGQSMGHCPFFIGQRRAYQDPSF